VSLPLLFSLLALLVGPLVYRSARARRSAAAVDAFALVAVAGLVFMHILPQSFELAGWWVLPVALIGAFGPGLLCGSRLFHGRESRLVALPLALLAIALHALLDGVAIVSSDVGGHGTSELALAVVIHRIPVGLGIWWLVRPLYGLRAAVSLLVGIAVFSMIGFYSGEVLLDAAPERWIALVQALLAGSLLHVILRHPPTATGEEPARRWHAASALGGLAAALLVFGMGWLHLHGEEQAAHTQGAGEGFVALALESAPALLFAYLVVAGAHALLLDLFGFLRRGSAWGQALRGTLVGLPVPVCSCGVIPLYRSLVVGGVPATAAMAFLVATPELELAAVVLSLSLLGPEVTVARVGAAFVLALLVGRIVGAAARPAAVVGRHADEERPPLRRRLRDGLSYGFGDMVDSTAPWILVGIAMAAAAEPLLTPETFAGLPQLLEVPLFALIGMPIYVCASGSTPLVAVLLAKGVSPGAAIAFLMTGPATNLTTFGVLSRLHGRGTALAFGATTAVFAVLIGYAVDGLMPATGAALPDLHEHAASWWQWAALVALALVYLVSLFRQGVRGFVGQVIAPHTHGHGAEEDACCDHEHAHGHAH
jgi:hypothetical protein